MQAVSVEVGGLLCAKAAGQLPRNENQVSYLRRSTNVSRSSPSNPTEDDLFIIMQRAHTQDPVHKFVRDVKTALEPAIVLAEDQQLKDLVRFCTFPFDFSIFTVDPTFSLGEFDVTPLTYRNLLLESKRTSQPPVFLGPVLVHYKKTFATYLFLHHRSLGTVPSSRELEYLVLTEKNL